MVPYVEFTFNIIYSGPMKIIMVNHLRKNYLLKSRLYSVGSVGGILPTLEHMLQTKTFVGKLYF